MLSVKRDQKTLILISVYLNPQPTPAAKIKCLARALSRQTKFNTGSNMFFLRLAGSYYNSLLHDRKLS